MSSRTAAWNAETARQSHWITRPSAKRDTSRQAMRHVKRCVTSSATMHKPHGKFSLGVLRFGDAASGWGPAAGELHIRVLSVEVLAHLASELLLRDNASARCHASAPHSLWSAWRKGSAFAQADRRGGAEKLDNIEAERPACRRGNRTTAEVSQRSFDSSSSSLQPPGRQTPWSGRPAPPGASPLLLATSHKGHT
jgi:hypothetical protein